MAAGSAGHSGSTTTACGKESDPSCNALLQSWAPLEWPCVVTFPVWSMLMHCLVDQMLRGGAAPLAGRHQNGCWFLCEILKQAIPHFLGSYFVVN